MAVRRERDEGNVPRVECGVWGTMKAVTGKVKGRGGDDGDGIDELVTQ